jgi:hypothetical protein
VCFSFDVKEAINKRRVYRFLDENGAEAASVIKIWISIIYG